MPAVADALAEWDALVSARAESARAVATETLTRVLPTWNGVDAQEKADVAHATVLALGEAFDAHPDADALGLVAGALAEAGLVDAAEGALDAHFEGHAAYAAVATARALAEDAAAGGAPADAEHVRALVRAHMGAGASADEDPGTRHAPEGEDDAASSAFVVTVTDGARTRTLGGDEDATAVLGLGAGTGHGIRVGIPPYLRAGSWSAHVTVTEPDGSGATLRVPLDALQSPASGSVAAGIVDAWADGSSVRFHLERDAGAGVTRFGEDEPWSYAFDAHGPVTRVEAQRDGATDVTAHWHADDGTGVGVDRVTVHWSVDDGPWNTLLPDTRDARVTVRGEPGHAYRFKACATDFAGDEGPCSDVAEARVPANASAPGNRAPEVSIVAPGENAFLVDGTSVRWKLDDPDGSQPFVRVSLEPAGSEPVTLYSGSGSGFTFRAGAYPDGLATLRVVASDGALEDVAALTVRVDASPPRVVGVHAQPHADAGVRVSARVLDASGASVLVAGRGGTVTLEDDGNGVWTGIVHEDPHAGFAFTVRAEDAAGNVAQRMSAFVPTRTVPAPASAEPAVVALDTAQPDAGASGDADDARTDAEVTPAKGGGERARGRFVPGSPLPLVTLGSRARPRALPRAAPPAGPGDARAPGARQAPRDGCHRCTSSDSHRWHRIVFFAFVENVYVQAAHSTTIVPSD